MAWAELPGLRLYYERGGSGAPVVYVHGGVASLATRLADFSDSGWKGGDWERDLALRFDFVSYERRAATAPMRPPTATRRRLRPATSRRCSMRWESSRRIW